MSKLLEMSEEFRKKLISKNTYHNENAYGDSHKDALSDGDNRGRGENDGKIGTSDDIEQREKTVVKNKYKDGSEYGEGDTV
ncbi:MAG: hypothetical protein ACOC2W_01040 [bacterium]